MLFRSHIRAVYDEEIAYTDRWIGHLLDSLKKRKLDESTIVIIVSDHGEYFMERGRFLHDGDVYCELVHVPLIIGGAIPEEFKGTSVSRTVELISLPKTIATMANIKNTPFKGEDLLSLAGGEPKPRYGFSEGTWAWKKDNRTVGVKYDGWKLICNLDDNRYELYRSRVDPKERNNLWNSTNPDTVKMRKQLKKVLDHHISTVMKFTPKADAVQLTAEEKAQLEALGYVE